MDSTPLVLVTGQVGSDAAGHRRLSGDQLHRHHAGRHQMELPGQAPRGHSRGHRQGLLHRPLGAPGSRRGRHHQGRTMREQLRSATKKSPRSAVTSPAPRPRRGTHRRSRTADRPGPPSAGRWWVRASILGNAEAELRALARSSSGMPAASTLLGLSALPTDHPQNVGMLGMHGNYGPNIKNQGVRPARGRGHAFRRPRDGESRRISAPMPR